MISIEGCGVDIMGRSGGSPRGKGLRAPEHCPSACPGDCRCEEVEFDEKDERENFRVREGVYTRNIGFRKDAFRIGRVDTYANATSQSL